MTSVLDPDQREKTAHRLLGSASRASYSPDLDIDWDSPEVPGLAHMQPQRTSLFGTALWNGLSDEQRVELTKHEAISIARVGLWFEILLMGMLADHIYDEDPGTQHAQYGLTEIGDETRHSVMFARWVHRYGGNDYSPPASVRRLGKVFRLIAPSGPAMWAGTLVAEEMLDRGQRELMGDESVQPLSRMIARIHVVEEARHVRFAKEELIRSVAATGRTKLAFHRLLTALTSAVIAGVLISPKVYRSVGLDQQAALAARKDNENFHDTIRWMGEKVMPFLEEAGMVTGISRRIYRRAHLL